MWSSYIYIYTYIGALHRARGGPDRYIVCLCFYLLLFMLRYLHCFNSVLFAFIHLLDFFEN